MHNVLSEELISSLQKDNEKPILYKFQKFIGLVYLAVDILNPVMQMHVFKPLDLLDILIFIYEFPHYMKLNNTQLTVVFHYREKGDLWGWESLIDLSPQNL